MMETAIALAVFVIGILAVVGFVVKLKLPAFIGLTLSAIVVGVVSPQIPFGDVPGQVASGFGAVMAAIGIPILMAAVIGKAIMDSGAAQRIVRAFLDLTGEENSDVSLLGSSYLLSIPVFFDNVFYLLAPLARAMKASTGKKYPVYIAAISAGALGTHMLVPPTPGPLAMSATIGVDVGMVMLVGIIIAIPTTVIGGLIYGRWIDSKMDIPLREAMGSTKETLMETVEKPTSELPAFGEALLPILVPVLFVGSNTIADAMGASSQILSFTSFIGDPAFALTTAALIASATLAKQKGFSLDELSDSMEKGLKSGGMIIAITSAGGAFGGMLKAAGVGDAFAGSLQEIGIPILISAWLIAGLIRIAQGSGTVALLTGSSIMAPFAPSLGVHPVYLVMAIGTGGMMFSWFNDSGFWIINRVAGLTNMETFKCWSAVNTVMSIVGITFTLIMATIFPMA